MNTKLFLLLGTSLSFIPTLTLAQCVATQDCATLGYTETSCSGGKGVKCPFGNKWACFKSDSEIEQQFCDKYGFQYTCTGTGYSGNVGKACNGKYTSCICSSGYEWKNGACTDTCTIGTLYYSDGTCSPTKVSGKTILGVVIMERTSSANGWIMSISLVRDSSDWSQSGTDIPGLNNITSEVGLTDVQASCTNTDIITQYGDSSTYPAAWVAKNYKPSGTPSGKTWCLPSGGLLNSALTNSTNFAKINHGITTAGGKAIGYHRYPGGYHYEDFWSSSEYDTDKAWYFYATSEGSLKMYKGSKYRSNPAYATNSVRPVLAF